jgi:hypothetical protein
MRSAFRASKNSNGNFVFRTRIEFVAGGDVAATFEKVILGIECLGSSLRVLANFSGRGSVYTLRRIKNDRCRLSCLSKIAHM